DKHAWAAGPEGVVATTDGGEHWQAQLAFGKGPFSDAQVGFVDTGHGFAYVRGTTSQPGPKLYQTSDGGRHWRGRGGGRMRPGAWGGPPGGSGPPPPGEGRPAP